MELDNKKSAIAYLYPDRQMGKSEEAALQPPQLLTSRGKAMLTKKWRKYSPFF
ncbi:MAG: hypothetical protein ABS934_04885 [Psychrobacillus sp.]